MKTLSPTSSVSAAAVLAAMALPASAASFTDTFDTTGDVANNYTGFDLRNFETADNVDAFNYNSGSSFALDTANSQVDLVSAGPPFNLTLLSRSVDAANLYDINQGVSLTLNASGLDPIGFSAIRNPVTFGISGGTLNEDITVQIQNVNDSTTRLSVEGEGGAVLPEGAQADYAFGPNGVTFELTIDDDSYSVLADGAVLIADTLHGRTFSSLEGVVPTIGARRVFDGGGNTDVSINSFAGEGVTVPEPATAGLLAAGGLLLVRRRRSA